MVIMKMIRNMRLLLLMIMMIMIIITLIIIIIIIIIITIVIMILVLLIIVPIIILNHKTSNDNDNDNNNNHHHHQRRPGVRGVLVSLREAFGGGYHHGWKLSSELEFLDSSFSSLSSYLKVDKQLSDERFEATVSQSTVPSTPLKRGLSFLRACAQSSC